MERRTFIKRLLTGAAIVPLASITVPADEYLEVCGNCKNFINRKDICSTPDCDLEGIPLEFGFCNRPPIKGDGRLPYDELKQVTWDHGCWNCDGACVHYRDARREQFRGAKFKEVRSL